MHSTSSTFVDFCPSLARPSRSYNERSYKLIWVKGFCFVFIPVINKIRGPCSGFLTCLITSTIKDRISRPQVLLPLDNICDKIRGKTSYRILTKLLVKNNWTTNCFSRSRKCKPIQMQTSYKTACVQRRLR